MPESWTKLSRVSIASGCMLAILLSCLETGLMAASEDRVLNNAKAVKSDISLIFKSEEVELDTNKQLEYLTKKYSSVLSNLNPKLGYPRSKTRDESWLLTETNKWTSGFLPGILWYLYKYSGDKKLLRQAQAWTEPIAAQKYNRGTHDLGFIIFNSFGNGYDLTSNGEYKQVILEAANSLASRYNPKIGVIKSWDWNSNKPWCTHEPSWTYPVIIDNMMNLELLFWAAKNGGDTKYYDLAVNHARKTIQNHLRSDGSTYHVVDYDRFSGNVSKRVTWQGWSNDSVWARGQAWGLYGFTMTYRETKDREFLAAAEQLANYWIKNLPADKIPYWDFKVPQIANLEKDSSAAAIAASGLLELSTLTDDQNKQQLYLQIGKQILSELSSPAYLNRKTNKIPLILHAVGNYPCKEEIDVSIIYGDYYYIEALLRYDAIIRRNRRERSSKQLSRKVAKKSR